MANVNGVEAFIGLYNSFVGAWQGRNIDDAESFPRYMTRGAINESYPFSRGHVPPAENGLERKHEDGHWRAISYLLSPLIRYRLEGLKER